MSTEHPLCVLTKAECPGDKRGRSGLRGAQSQGEERVGKRGGGEGEGKERWRGEAVGEGEICWGLNRPTQSPRKTLGTLRVRKKK